MKLINRIQNYPHIIELHACILQIFVVTFLFPISFIISFRISSTQKLPKYATYLAFT